jgi:hypothetical protein
MGTAAAVALGVGGALALYLLFKRSEAPAGQPPPCFTNIAGVPVPCSIAQGATTAIVNGLGAISRNPGAANPIGALTTTATSGLGSHNSCPPGTTDKGWRGCFDASGKRVERGSGDSSAPAAPGFFSGLTNTLGLAPAPPSVSYRPGVRV